MKKGAPGWLDGLSVRLLLRSWPWGPGIKPSEKPASHLCSLSNK